MIFQQTHSFCYRLYCFLLKLHTFTYLNHLIFQLQIVYHQFSNHICCKHILMFFLIYKPLFQQLNLILLLYFCLLQAVNERAYCLHINLIKKGSQISSPFICSRDCLLACKTLLEYFHWINYWLIFWTPHRFLSLI